MPAWQALEQHHSALAGVQLRRLFEEEPARFDRLSATGAGILLDYSKQLVTSETMRLLVALARECRLEKQIKRLFAAERVNITENRAALHMALRAAKPVMLDGADVTREVAAVLVQMKKLADAVRSGRARGATGRKFTDIVNIGIGGSDLGPRFVCDALARDSHSPVRAHFVSNVDGAATTSVLDTLDPATTLVIVASKTFTTAETLENANTARAWLARRLRGKNAVAKHLCAVSSAPERTAKFGVPADRVFQMWDWVGGRYSLWSAVGLPIAIALGMKRFDELRAGAREIDEHFISAPLERNLPVLLGLLQVWNVNFRGTMTHAVLPYDERLRLLPSYLQQLEMESCGKSATLDGDMVAYGTVPVIWGTPGTDGQHAYFQMLHQGTSPVPADFIACCRPHHRLRRHHDMLLANFFAQTEALARGLTPEEAGAAMREQGLPQGEIARLLAHRVFPGNRPTNSILLEELTPRTLGALIALYEHKVFVQSVIWNINAFDQWGVELGKQLASRILPELDGTAKAASHDVSTAGLIKYYKARRRAGRA